jgi:CO dehydrogenase/acetyl-CoA synthase gamma subunit (corrinoid Fe-S protein)
MKKSSQEVVKEDKPVIYAISEKKINDVKMTLSKMTFDLSTHQQLQGLIDYLIKP